MVAPIVSHTLPALQQDKIAAVYARVSTSEQADRGFSLPTQLEACQALAQHEGYSVPDTHVFVDDYTGTSLNRPQFLPLRDLVRQRLVAAVFVYDLDRLSRKLAHQLLLSEEFEQAGVALRIVTMPDGAKTPEQQMFASMKGVFAEYERAKILERTERGRRERAKSGHVPHGHHTLGYTYVKHADRGEYYDPDTNQCRACGRKGDKGACYVPHPEEAALVQRIFRLYVEERYSVDAIAALLTVEGIPTPKDKLRTLPVPVWHGATIARILKNTTYIGTLYYGKMEVLPGKRNPDKKTRQRSTPRETWIPVPVPPIIDLALFQATQTRAITNKQQSKRNRRHEYLLVCGRMRCGQCGAKMHGEYNPEGYARYRCNRGHYRHMDVIAPHRRRRVSVLAVDPIVWDAVERALKNPAVITAELERRKHGVSTQHADLDRERQHYTRLLAQCDRESTKVWEAYTNDVDTLAEYKTKKATVDARRASIVQELVQLDEQQRLTDQLDLDIASLTDYCARVQSALQHFTMEEKRRALEALDITVTWHPEQPLKITGSIPVEIVSPMSCAMRSLA
jgi:site-specific DNA recombinase